MKTSLLVLASLLLAAACYGFGPDTVFRFSSPADSWESLIYNIVPTNPTPGAPNYPIPVTLTISNNGGEGGEVHIFRVSGITPFFPMATPQLRDLNMQPLANPFTVGPTETVKSFYLFIPPTPDGMRYYQARSEIGTIRSLPPVRMIFMNVTVSHVDINDQSTYIENGILSPLELVAGEPIHVEMGLKFSPLSLIPADGWVSLHVTSQLTDSDVAKKMYIWSDDVTVLYDPLLDYAPLEFDMPDPVDDTIGAGRYELCFFAGYYQGPDLTTILHKTFGEYSVID